MDNNKQSIDDLIFKYREADTGTADMNDAQVELRMREANPDFMTYEVDYSAWDNQYNMKNTFNLPWADSEGEDVEPQQSSKMSKGEFLYRYKKKSPDLNYASDDELFNAINQAYPDYVEENVEFTTGEQTADYMRSGLDAGKVFLRGAKDSIDAIGPGIGFIKGDLEAGKYDTAFRVNQLEQEYGRPLTESEKYYLSMKDAQTPEEVSARIDHSIQGSKNVLSSEDKGIVPKAFAVGKLGIDYIRKFKEDTKAKMESEGNPYQHMPNFVRANALNSLENFDQYKDSMMGADNVQQWAANVGGDFESDWYDAQQEMTNAQQEILEMQQDTEDFANSIGWDSNSIGYGVAAAGPQMIGSILTATAVGAVAGPAAASIAPAVLLATPDSLQVYMQARQAGATRDEAKEYAIVTLAGSAMLEKLGLDETMSKLGGKAVTSYARASLAEGLTEFSQAELLNVVAALGYDSEAYTNASRDELYDLMVKQPMKAGVIGGIMGLGGKAYSQNLTNIQKTRLKAAVTSKVKYTKLNKVYEGVREDIQKSIDKTISKEFDLKGDFSEENVQRIAEKLSTKRYGTEQLSEWIKASPQFRIADEVSKANWLARFTYGENQVDSKGLKLLNNMKSFINRGVYDNSVLLKAISPTAYHLYNDMARVGQGESFRMSDKLGTQLNEAAKTLPSMGKKVRLTDNKGNSKQLRIQEILIKYMYDKQGLRKRMQNQDNIRPVADWELDAITKYVESSPEMQQGLEAFNQMTDSLFEVLDEAYYEQTGKRLNKVENYLTLVYESAYESGGKSVDFLESLIADSGKKKVGKSTTPGQAKDRVHLPTGDFDYTVNPLLKMQSAIKGITDYAGMLKPMQAFEQQMKGMKTPIIRHMGKDYYNRLMRNAEVLYKGAGYKSNILTKTMETLRRGSYGVFTANIPVGVAQTASAFGGMAEIGIDNYMAGSRYVLANPKAALAEFQAESLEGKFRFVDITQEEMSQAAASLADTKLASAQQLGLKTAKALTYHMRVFDLYTTMSVYFGSKIGTVDIDPNTGHAETVSIADDAITMSQPMTNSIHRGEAFRNPTAKTFMMFTNAITRSHAQHMNAMIDFSKGDLNANEFVKNYVLTKIAPALWISLIRAVLRDEEPIENVWKKLLGSNFVLGHLISAIDFGDGNITVPGVRPFTIGVRSMTNLYDGDVMMAVYNALEASLGLATGMSIQSPIRGVEKLLRMD